MNSLNFKKLFILLTCLTAILLITSRPISARPSDAYKQHSYISFCIEDERQLNLCQKCAKVTKSADVYPDCCLKKDGVYGWCLKYVHFGVNSDN